ncbi:MAG TPA: disulfide bond formation protein B [Burkholderiaceae bacterium]|nr:disulfide bond formation protein B [Burkholderiaceae bacterium]
MSPLFVADHVDRSPRVLLGAAAVVIVASLAFGLYLQHVQGIEPCPLCVVQRLGFVLAGVFALLGVAFGARPSAQIVFAALTALFALVGAGVAAWHVWLIAHPPAVMSCGRPFAWMLDNFPLATLIPKLFRGEGDCLRVDWTMLGLSIPDWSLLLFIAVSALALVALTRARRAR